MLQGGKYVSSRNSSIQPGHDRNYHLMVNFGYDLSVDIVQLKGFLHASTVTSCV